MNEHLMIKISCAVNVGRVEEIRDRVDRYMKGVGEPVDMKSHSEYWIGKQDLVELRYKSKFHSFGTAYERSLFLQGAAGLKEEEVVSIEFHKWPEEEV